MISENIPKIGVAIVQWNHSNLTLSLIKSLSEHNTKYRAAICDNGSDQQHIDSVLTFLNSQYKTATNDQTDDWQFKLISNHHNSGFAKATNKSIQSLLSTGCEWIWLLNNDVSVNSDILDSLPQQLIGKAAGLYGMTIREAENNIIVGGYSFNFWTTRYNPITTATDFTKPPQQNNYISGASLIIHREVFESIGLLNEQTFLYFEELDFTFRARNHGYHQYFLDGPIIEHKGAGSSGGPSSSALKKRIYHETWSTLNFYANHKPFLFLWILIFRTPMRLATLIISKRSNLIPTVLKASFDFFRGNNADRSDVKIKAVTTFYEMK